MSENLKSVVISIDPESLEKVSITVDKLKGMGLRNISVLEALGIITGNVSEDDLVVLKTLPDITVEDDEPVQIPDPDSPLM